MQIFEAYAREIIEGKLGEKTARIQQFPTGLSHYVYDVLTEEGFTFVVRIARPERNHEFDRGLNWHRIIEKVGVRLPKIFEIGKIEDHPFAVYERLEGEDLENVYSGLSLHEKKHIAEEVAEIQQKISWLDRELFEKTSPWVEFLERIVSRSEREILSHGLCTPKYVDLIRFEIEKHTEYFQTLKPGAFLYDLSVRNVIVLDGRITGIIDVDDVWFGDSLLAIGRGKTILIAMKQDTYLINHWCEYLALSEQEIEMVDFYALLYCLRFMGTIGAKLNGNASIQTDPKNARLFVRLADKLLNV